MCEVCGWNYPAEFGGKTIRECPEQQDIKRPTTPPGIITKTASYVKAVATHIATGAKTRDQSEIDRIFAICESNECGEFNGKGCNICGCCVGKTRKALTNKIAMASQNCPREKW